MTTSRAEAAELVGLGPVSYLIVEFPGGKMTGQGLPFLVDLVDRGLIRILDLEFISRAADGSIRTVELREIEHDAGPGLEVFEGAFSGLLDATDFEEARSAIAPGSTAAILIFENRWAKSFVEALRRGGAQPVAAGYIPQDILAEAVEATEH